MIRKSLCLKHLLIALSLYTKTYVKQPLSTYRNLFSRPTIAYCKFGNFRENFILVKSVKRHICNI